MFCVLPWSTFYRTLVLINKKNLNSKKKLPLSHKCRIFVTSSYLFCYFCFFEHVLWQLRYPWKSPAGKDYHKSDFYGKIENLCIFLYPRQTKNKAITTKLVSWTRLPMSFNSLYQHLITYVAHHYQFWSYFLEPSIRYWSKWSNLSKQTPVLWPNSLFTSFL